MACVSTFANKSNEIYFGDEHKLLTIKTVDNKNIYLKYTTGTKTFSDIKKFIFNHIKYKCNNVDNPALFTFRVNNIPLCDIICSDGWPIGSCNKIKDEILLIDSIADSGSYLRLYLQNGSLDGTSENFYDSWDNISHKFIFDNSIDDKDLQHFFVKDLCGKTILIKCNPNETTVEEFKYAIRHKTSTDNDSMRLIFNGKQLDPKNKLSEYQINNYSIIYLVFRLRGGMFNEVSGRNGNYEKLDDIFFDMDSLQEESLTKNQSKNNITCFNI